MSGKTQDWRCWCSSLVVGSVLIASLQEQAFAQITPDTSLPNNSSVARDGNIFNITGGTKAGSNLFHSFREFSVSPGDTASFNNAVDIQNIISRVTGGSFSNINGLIRAKGNANLFLINPNGIVFGENARLNIGGSFVASTANALQFGNIGFFSATDKNIPSPLLTINPSAFLFNQINQNAVIQNSSVAPARTNPAGFDALGLRVPDGKSLLLVGGNVSMDKGRLNAYGGQVELGGLAEPGSVALGVDGDNLSLKFPENVTRADISFTNSAGVFVEAAGGGNIAVNGRNLEILEGTVLSAGIGEGLGTPDTVAGDITLNATGEIKVASGSIVSNEVGLGLKGNGGNIYINAATLSLDDAGLTASTYGQGNAGNVIVQARDTVSLVDNAGILSTVEPGGVGNGGNIYINAATLSLDGARLEASTYAQGNAGNVTVSAKDAVSLADNAAIFSTVEAGGVGKGGNIDINAAKLSLIDGAQLQTVTDNASDLQPAGRGDAGNVNVNVTGAVDIAGGKNGLSGIGSFVKTGTEGNGGNITIDSGSFSLSDRAILDASTSGQGNAGNVTVRARDAVSLADVAIFSRVESGAVGKGGNININAAKLSLIDGAQLQTVTDNASDLQPAGRGDAGNVNVNVTGAVDIAGGKNGLSGIGSFVKTGTEGNGGNITIDSGSFSLSDRAILDASTSGQGNAGNVTVRAKDSVSLANNASIFSHVRVEGVGKAGDIDINAATLSLDRAGLDASTSGQGNAGNVRIRASRAITFDRASSASSTVKPGAVGNGGDIDITTESLSLTNRAGLDASTSGQGNAGNVRIRASRAITFDRASSASSTVKPGAVGNGGDIDITTESLSLTNRTGLDTTTYGQGKAGNVKIQASGAITFDGGNEGVVSSVQSSVGPTGMGDGGNIDIQSSYFSLTGGAELISGVFQGGQGNSGNITINVSNYINLSGVNTNGGPSSGLFTDPEENSKGQGGDILLSADVLKISDGATLSARTRNAFRGGNIIVNVNSLDLTGGGQILTAAFDKGDAGDITIEATKGITISGSDPTFDARLAQFGRPYVDPVNSLSGLFANTDVNSTGKGGSITITTGQLQVQNQAQVTVSSTGEGIAGELGITANTVKLNNGSITAQTRFGNGGDLTLGVKDLLLLRNSSQISTTAGNEQNGGDGGNITIKAPNGFIFAVPSENSDITANAFSGSGGRVDIKAFGIYGIEFRESPTPLSDITASSKFGIQGIVELNTPVIEINSGLIELPTIPVDTKLAQGCYSPGSAQNRFVITGRGGLPPNPKDILTPDTPQIDWVSLKPSSNNRSLPPVTSEPTTSTPKRIVEATGATLNAKGQIVLSAKSSTSTLNTSRQNPIQCHGS